MEYNFRVVPCIYKRGYCPTYVQTLEDALAEQIFLDGHTDFAWAIEGLNEQAEQELSGWLDEVAETIENLAEDIVL